MSFRSMRPWLGAVILVWGWVSAANAQTLTATWYTVSSSDPDRPFPYSGGAVYSNEVLAALGPNGLPEFNSSYPGPAIHDLYNSGGVEQIAWWSPAHDSNVTETGTSTITLPLNYPCTSSSNCIFPPNGGGTQDAGTAGYQAATFSGTLSPKTSETVSFSVGADDVAFVYLNGEIVCDLGGVHPDTPGTCTTGMLTAGTSNSLEIFYADLRPAAAALNFSLVTTNVTVCPAGTTGPSCTPTTGGSPGGSTGVPEPATLGLMGLGFLGAAWSRRRRCRARRSHQG